MIQAMVHSRNQFRCLEMQNQIVLSMFDQEIFGEKNKITPSNTTTKDIWASLHRQNNSPFADGSHWFTNVGHLVTYGGGYYGYLYSQVFASGIWDQLFHKRSLERESGERIWKKLLIHGGSRDANVMLEDLLGQKPTVENYWKNLTT
jgi:Zn-dependent oligopeptidase